MYGVSYTHMGQVWATDTLNKFLQRFGAEVLFEVLRDEPMEQRQPEGRQVLYALAGSIARTRRPAACGTTGMPSGRSLGRGLGRCA